MSEEDDDPAPKVAYAMYRLQGYGQNKAAERAGYAGGRPSPTARKLWQAAKKEQGVDTARRLVELRKDVAKLEFELERKERRLRAVRVLRRHEGQRHAQNMAKAQSSDQD